MVAGRFAGIASAAAAVALPLRESVPAPRRRPAVVRKPARRSDLPLGARLAAWVRALPDHRLLERLIGGRLWIVLIGTLLVGLVTLQLSLLRLNAGIGSAVQQSTSLEEQNRAMRVLISQRSDAERIIYQGSQMGLVMPPQGSPRFLATSGGDAANAAERMHAPDAATAAAASAMIAETSPDTADGATVDPETGEAIDPAAGAAIASDPAATDDGTGIAADGTSATTDDGTAASGTADDGTAATGVSDDGTTADGTTADGTTADGTTADGTTADSSGADTTTADSGATTSAGGATAPTG